MKIYLVISIFHGVLDETRAFWNEKDAQDEWERQCLAYNLDPTEPMPGYNFAGHSDENDVWLIETEIQEKRI